MPLDLSPLEHSGPAVAGWSARGDSTVAGIAGTDPATVFRIASLTKPVTAVATVRAAVAAGTDLDTRVLDVLPELGSSWRADPTITVAHLLAQTAGLAPAVTAAEVAALGDGDAVLVEVARRVGAGGSVREPGGRWEYYNGNYFVAGAVLARLHGATYEDAVRDLVLAPAGMGTTTYDVALPPGYPRGRRPSGGLGSTVPDLLAFCRDLLADRPLLATIAARRTPTADPMAYGLGWAIGPSGQLYLNGRLPGWRAAMLLVPEHELAGVVLVGADDALPAAARVLSDLQVRATGDDLAELVDAFAA